MSMKWALIDVFGLEFSKVQSSRDTEILMFLGAHVEDQYTYSIRSKE